jgi:hypothetical protein
MKRVFLSFVLFLELMSILSCMKITNNSEAKEAQTNVKPSLVTNASEIDASVSISYSEPVIYNNYKYRICYKSYGNDKELEREFGIQFENIDYSINVLDSNDNCVYTIPFIDEITRLEITDEFGFQLLKVGFSLKGFTTSPEGYSGFEYYIPYDTSNSAMNTTFYWYYEYAGSQVSPAASIETNTFSNSSLTLKYKYYENVEDLKAPWGTFTIIYSISQYKVEDISFISDIYADGEHMDNVKVDYSEIDINSKLMGWTRRAFLF